MHVTKIPGSALQVNNIIVILESAINYDYVIMIIKQAMLHPASKNLQYLVSICGGENFFWGKQPF